LKTEIIKHNGSVQNIDIIPENIKELYKTVWEMKMRDIIDMAADRGAFIDQSQSMNLFMENANMGKVTGMHFYAWKKGLKTGMYYLRTKAAADAIKFTVQKQAKAEVTPVLNSDQTKNLQEDRQNKLQEAAMKKEYTNEEALACSLDNPDACEACGS
jgi:ribonucleoside-diphosphate reductase alpha chain